MSKPHIFTEPTNAAQLDTRLNQRVPMAQWEQVEVVFGAANTDLRVPYTLRPDSPSQLAYLVIRQSAPGVVYQGEAARTSQDISLRASVDGLRATLWLFIPYQPLSPPMLDPSTTSLGAIWGSQAANLIYAGPASGPAAHPRFRSLVVADFNGGTGADSTTYWRGDGVWSTPPSGGGGGGTVTSVALALPGEFSVSGSPITGGGTLTGAWVNQTAHAVFAAPIGGAGTPAFRALTASDIPTIAWSQVSKTSSSLADLATRAVANLSDGAHVILDSGSYANPTWITSLAWSKISSPPSTYAPSAHDLTGAAHTASGLTTGHFLRATGATAFGFGTAASTDLSDTTNLARLNVSNSFAGSVLPATTDTYDLGSTTKRWRQLFAGELAIGTLVATTKLATIGGRVIVAPTTTLAVDLAPGDTTISVNAAILSNGDRLYLESAGEIEWMAVTSAVSGVGPYTYSVTRNLDGSGANSWAAGDAVVDTGTTGAGWIEQFASTALSGAAGPSMIGYLRSGTTYSDYAPRWAIGQLYGTGYSAASAAWGFAAGNPSATWITADDLNGFRVGYGGTTKVAVDPSGNASFTGSITASGGSIGGWTIDATSLSKAAAGNTVGLATAGSYSIYAGPTGSPAFTVSPDGVVTISPVGSGVPSGGGSASAYNFSGYTGFGGIYGAVNGPVASTVGMALTDHAALNTVRLTANMEGTNKPWIQVDAAAPSTGYGSLTTTVSNGTATLDLVFTGTGLAWGGGPAIAASAAWATASHAHAATDITSGTLNDARLSTNVPLLNASNTFTGITQAISGTRPVWLLWDGTNAASKVRVGTNAQSATGANVFLSGNASWDGSNWNLDNTAYGGGFLRLGNDGGLRLGVLSAGTNPRTVSSLFTISTTGSLYAEGEITWGTGVWDDLVIAANGINPNGPDGSMSIVTSATGHLGALLATASGTPSCVCIFQLSHQTKLGVDLHPHVHWVKDDATDNTGTVVWEAKFRHVPLNGAASAWSAYTTGILALDPGDVANVGALTYWTLADSTYHFGISDIIEMVVRRNGGTSGDAVLLSADIHYQKVRLGSIAEAALP